MKAELPTLPVRSAHREQRPSTPIGSRRRGDRFAPGPRAGRESQAALLRRAIYRNRATGRIGDAVNRPPRTIPVLRRLRRLERSIAEARKLAALARRAVGRGAGAKRRAAQRLQEMADRCEKVAAQIRQRVAGEPISDRLVSLTDPDVRPIRKGKLGKPNEFGYVSQICEVTEHTRRGARGLIVPALTRLGNPGEDTLLPDTISELARLAIRPREIVLDGGFNPGPTRQALDDHGLEPKRVFIAGRQQPASRQTQRRLQRYRTGAEGRISHLKRGYGLNRSRLKGDQGRQTWTG
jgi:IS5 family transposase